MKMEVNTGSPQFKSKTDAVTALSSVGSLDVAAAWKIFNLLLLSARCKKNEFDMRLLVADKDGDDASALDVAEIARDYGKIISILEPLLFLLGITSPWMRWHSFLDLLDAELPPEDADPPTPSS